MAKIIAVCPQEYPGVNAVFAHGEALGLWEHFNLKQDLPENDLVILGAWHPYYLEYLERYNCVIYLTSSFGQMEFSNNMIEIQNLSLLHKLLEENKIKALLAGWPDVVDYFLENHPLRAFYCPYPFSEEYVLNECKGAEIKERNSLGIFLPCAPRKNTFNQIIAAIKSGMKIYTNLPYNIPGLEKVGWLPRKEYFQLISKMAVTLHCTFTETFSYAAAESLILGTLPIVSLQVAERLSLEDLTCVQCDSVRQILGKINEIKALEESEYANLLIINQELFKERNKKRFELTKKVLDEVLTMVVK